MRAANYVGKGNSLKYWGKVGHMPNQQDLFKSLLKMPADTDLQTYNNDLKMPLVFSSWLINSTPASKLLQEILNYLQKSNLSPIEKTVLGNVVDMMLTPDKLIDIQKPINETLKIASELRSKGFKVYLVGNWSNLSSLKTHFSQMLSTFNGVYLSGTIHTIKPYQDFYEYILEKTDTPINQAIWVEREGEFIKKAKSYGYHVASFNAKAPKALASELSHFGINIK